MNKATLLVGGLGLHITSEILSELFGSVGKVVFAFVAFDVNNHSTRCGFVEMENPDFARQAAEKFDGYNLQWKVISVRVYISRFNRVVHNSMIDYFKKNENDLKDFKNEVSVCLEHLNTITKEIGRWEKKFPEIKEEVGESGILLANLNSKIRRIGGILENKEIFNTIAVSGEEFVLQNGLLGLNRDILMRLIKVIQNGKKIRKIIGMAQTLYVWAKLPIFRWARKPLHGVCGNRFMVSNLASETTAAQLADSLKHICPVVSATIINFHAQSTGFAFVDFADSITPVKRVAELDFTISGKKPIFLMYEASAFYPFWDRALKDLSVAGRKHVLRELVWEWLSRVKDDPLPILDALMELSLPKLVLLLNNPQDLEDCIQEGMKLQKKRIERGKLSALSLYM